MMAARGILPGAKPHEVLTTIAALAGCEDPELATLAQQSMRTLPTAVVSGGLQACLQAGVLRRLAEAYVENADIIQQLLRQSNVERETLAFLAERATEQIGELLATNEELMLAYPNVIEKLYMNKRVRMSTADRLIELAVRNQIELAIPAFQEAAQAILQQLVPEVTEERTFDDDLFDQTDTVAATAALDKGDEDTHEIDDEGEEHLRSRFLPLQAQLAQMTTSQRIRRAMLGQPAELLILVRDSNRLVAVAAAKSPRIRENEAMRITASRSISDEVLRVIALSRDLTRNYQVKYNLVVNPRTPFTFVSRLIPHLREADLKVLAKSKNVPGTVAQAISQQISRKQQRPKS